MQIKAKNLAAGDAIKIGGNRHTVDKAGQRGGYTDLTVINTRGKSIKFTCGANTPFIKIDDVVIDD